MIILQDDQYLTISEFGKLIGVHPATLRRWHKDGTLLPHHLTPKGARVYSMTQVNEYLGETTAPALSVQMETAKADSQ